MTRFRVVILRRPVINSPLAPISLKTLTTFNDLGEVKRW